MKLSEIQEWWKVGEVAKRWRCSADTVLRMIADGTIKAMRLGGAFRISQRALERYEAAGKPEVSRDEKPRKVFPKQAGPAWLQKM